MNALPSREYMLSRMLAADRACDGRFITGVTTTGIYCLPSCRAKKPKPDHVIFYATPTDARASGLRACLRCKPDDHYAHVDPWEERLSPLVDTLPLGEVRDVAALAAQVGVSSSKLHELWRTYFQETPAEWLVRQRVRRAHELLFGTPLTSAEVAFEVGFESLSVYGEQFRRWSGTTPRALREWPGLSRVTIRLPPVTPVQALLRDLGRDRRQTTERVEGRTYLSTFRLPSGPRTVALHFAAGQESGQVTCDLGGPAGSDAPVLYEMLRRRLGLTHEAARFEKALCGSPFAALNSGREGLRLPLYADPFDGVVWAVLGQGVTFAAACTLRRRVLQLTEVPSPGGLYPPPDAGRIAALSTGDLAALGLTRARADVLRHVSGLVAGGELDLTRLGHGPVTRAQRTLLDLPGIGPWTAAYVLLRVLGFQDALPAADCALAGRLQAFLGLPQRPNARQVETLLAPLSPHRSLATFHLWHWSPVSLESP